MSILLIITDQQRHDAIGYNSDICKTPNLDKLAESGTTFHSCYAQSPQCHPSRVSLMTGRYPCAHRSWSNADQLREEEVTISSMLMDRYECAYFGKMHLAGDGNDDRELMQRLGYSYWFTFFDWIDLCRMARSEEMPSTPHDEFAGIMQSKNWVGKFSRRELQHDEVITNKVIEYIKSNDDFFAVVSFYGPHPPYAAPPPFSEMYEPSEMPLPITLGERSAEEWQQIKSQYYGNISWLDDNIGRILEAVSDDDIVVFTSDHGDIMGDHGHFSKGFFGYEGNTRVPLIIRAPGLVPRDYSWLVEHIDILPTLLSLSDIEIPEAVQGSSLISSIQVNTKAKQYALSMVGVDPKLKILRVMDHKYWIDSDGKEKLFNLVDDPGELHNLDDEHLLAMMRKHMLLALINAED